MKKTVDGKYFLSMSFEESNKLDEALTPIECDNEKAEMLLQEIIGDHFEKDADSVFEMWRKGEDGIGLMFLNYGKVQIFLNIVWDYLFKIRKQTEELSELST